MKLRASLAIGAGDAAVVDVVPLDEASVLVSTADGALAVVETADARIARRLREAERGYLGPCAIIAVEPDLVVRWGWEIVDAVALSTGETRWEIADGDHSLDDASGRCAATPGAPYAVLVNGQVIDTRDGRDVFERPLLGEWGDALGAFVTRPDRGLVAAIGGALVQWNPRAHGLAVERLPSPPSSPRALAWVGESIASLGADGAVDLLSLDGVTPPARVLDAIVGAPGEVLLGAELSVSDDGASLVAVREVEDTRAYKTRYAIDVVALEAPPRATRVFEAGPMSISGDRFMTAHWTSPRSFVAAIRGALYAFTASPTWERVEAPSLPAVITASLARGTSLLLGDAKGALHILEAAMP